jgi:hypothetical protein
MDVSSELSMMSDAGFNLYHDQIDVQVLWGQSKACMVLPPEGYLTNCIYIASISAIPVLTALLLAVLALFAMLRRREGLTNVGVTRSKSAGTADIGIRPSVIPIASLSWAERWAC